jgi:hypothetical protein
MPSSFENIKTLSLKCGQQAALDRQTKESLWPQGLQPGVHGGKGWGAVAATLQILPRPRHIRALLMARSCGSLILALAPFSEKDFCDEP